MIPVDGMDKNNQEMNGKRGEAPRKRNGSRFLSPVAGAE